MEDSAALPLEVAADLQPLDLPAAGHVFVGGGQQSLVPESLLEGGQGDALCPQHLGGEGWVWRLIESNRHRQ